MLLVFEGIPELQKGRAVMQRDRFRSLTHSLTAGMNIEGEGEKMLHIGEKEKGRGEGR